MAALSFHSNCGFDSSSYHHPQQHFSSDTDFFQLPPPQLYGDLSSFSPVDYLPTDSPFFPNPFVDDGASFLYSDYCSANHVCPYSYAPAAGILPSDEFHYSKRQKVICANQPYLEPSLCCDGSYFPPPPELSLPWNDQGGGMSSGSCLKKLSPNNLSAQTIAARERRRKITAKTQELGELIPGGNKMNTAEMFHSAFKYVKFLQAQVAILELMQETEEEEAAGELGELQILESPVIQEKLYSEEKCLVPNGFVQSLADSPEIQSQPSIFNSINQILQTSSS